MSRLEHVIDLIQAQKFDVLRLTDPGGKVSLGHWNDTPSKLVKELKRFDQRYSDPYTVILDRLALTKKTGKRSPLDMPVEVEIFSKAPQMGGATPSTVVVEQAAPPPTTTGYSSEELKRAEELGELRATVTGLQQQLKEVLEAEPEMGGYEQVVEDSVWTPESFIEVMKMAGEHLVAPITAKILGGNKGKSAPKAKPMATPADGQLTPEQIELLQIGHAWKERAPEEYKTYIHQLKKALLDGDPVDTSSANGSGSGASDQGDEDQQKAA